MSDHDTTPTEPAVPEEVPADAVVYDETEVREIDIDGDGIPDGVHATRTEVREIDIDGDGIADIVETVTIEVR